MSLKKYKSIIFILCVGGVTLLSILFCSFVLYKVYNHEQRQSQDIASLRGQVSKLGAQIELLDKQGNIKLNFADDSFNYLCIGNSISKHPITDFWWNENGMAASTLGKDYYHRVVDYLKQKHKKVNSEVVNLSVWEVQSHDRGETLDFFKPYLSDKLDLVTIQLGENASNIDTFRQDYIELINYVKKSCPKAKILIVGDFWEYKDRDAKKKAAAKSCNVEYVSLEGIKDNQEYFVGMGTVVFDKDGKEHIIEHDGVARHPGDKGMEAIAGRIVEQLIK